MNILLNQGWTMRRATGGEAYACDVPCSMYKTLLQYGAIPDPFYRENEVISTALCDDDYTFAKDFSCGADILDRKRQLLVFEGIDTLAEVVLNGVTLGTTNDMHRRWEFDAEGILAGENRLEVRIASPTKYIARRHAERPIWGDGAPMAGFTHIRKAHCMFGWDWGPHLPDMGIWRDVKLVGFDAGRILSVRYDQTHAQGHVELNAVISVENLAATVCRLRVTDPDGKLVCEASAPVAGGACQIACEIENPQLWWVRGYGEQPLYTCTLELLAGEDLIDTNTQRIGLRTLTVAREKDAFGEGFCFVINGVKIFAMGANYIPEDQIVTRVDKARTTKLLDQCLAANYNAIRVWGGGYYPDDWFYDYCDEHGLIVWQDFMFACGCYLLTPEFEAAVRAEVRDNVIRLRGHASLGLLCGNNEIESAWEGWNLPDDPEAKRDYLILFEQIIPEIVAEYAPQTFYWPSSPSSGGGFDHSADINRGDMHYWAVWHGLKPIEDFRKYYYRFCSEYGFESLPSIKTCRAFIGNHPKDYNLTSPVVEAHQKCNQGNEKIMFYLAQMVRYPETFEELIYSSQLVQADSIRSNVEHMRRSRGRCMGSLYWQVNDSNPVISWSSIDYFGRWKPLHYVAAKFYAPILVSVDDSDIHNIVFNVSNETMRDEALTLRWSMRTAAGDILTRGEKDVTVAKLTAADVHAEDMSGLLATDADKRTRYLEYSVAKGGEVVSRGTLLFVRPKRFGFMQPNVTAGVRDAGDRYEITLTADHFAKSVWLDLREADCVFSDNWFDIHAGEPVAVSVSKDALSAPLDLDAFKAQLTVQAYNMW